MDEKIIILLQYERILMKMGNVMPEYNSVAELNESFGNNKNYVQDLRKKLMESGTINRKRGSGWTKLDISIETDVFKRKDRSIPI